MRLFVLLFIYIISNIRAVAQQSDTQQVIKHSDYALAKATPDFYYQEIPKFFDDKKVLNLTSGTTVFFKPILPKSSATINDNIGGTVTNEKGSILMEWSKVFDYAFTLEGSYTIMVHNKSNMVNCKAFYKKVIVTNDSTALLKDEPFTTTLNIGTGIKYYPETVTNKNIVREGSWQLVSGPPATIIYPTYGWAMLGGFSPDVQVNTTQKFNNVHWLTLNSLFNSSANNMHPAVPYIFVKKFALKEKDSITIDLTTLYDNHIAIYIDDKRLYLKHPIKSIEQLVNKEQLTREEMLERKETFNYSSNASFIKAKDQTIVLDAGMHQIKVALRSASQEIGFIFKGNLLSTTGKRNNFQPIGFVMTDVIKGAKWTYEKGQ